MAEHMLYIYNKYYYFSIFIVVFFEKRLACRITLLYFHIQSVFKQTKVLLIACTDSLDK